MFCRSVIIDFKVDLNDVCAADGMLFARNNYGYASTGLVATCVESEIDTLLNSIVNLSDHGPHPIAFSLVPFNPRLEAAFFVPRVLVTQKPDGSQTLTVTAQNEEAVSEAAVNVELEVLRKASPPQPTSNSFTVEPRMAVNSYLATVERARNAVNNKHIEKVVIARDIEVKAEASIDVHSVLHRLRASFGSSYRYCINNFVGASPELLVHIDGRAISSHPLAGTAPRTGDPDTDQRLAEELIASTKNQIEHRLVVDMVRDTLLPHCSYLDWEAEPSIVTVANVQHLGTAVEGALKEPTPPIMTFVRMLCPTPALGGHPTREAIDFINEFEDMDRGYYGGAVGIINRDGHGTFAVAIRCAQFSDDRKSARLFAGGGIVGQSEPLAELAETQAKFQAMLSAIVRP